MPGYTQDQHVFAVDTPLGKDVLLLRSFRGTEGISEPFDYQLDLLAENPVNVQFDKVLGQAVTVRFRLADGSLRWVNGVCYEMEAGARETLEAENKTFTSYRVRVVPKLSLLGLVHRSRVFQQLSVPEILEQLLAGISHEARLTATYDAREVCVQYRESDLAFASRLMEEEGIFYTFEHSAGDHKMVLRDRPVGAFDPLPGGATLIYEALVGGTRDEDRVQAWRKRQTLTRGKVTFRDRCFEMPTNDLERVESVLPQVVAGTVTHKLALANPEARELYGFRGGHVKPYDGVAPGGGDQSGNLQKIFTYGTQRAKVVMEREDARAVVADGWSNLRQLASGYTVTLTKHHEDNGSWVVASVQHAGSNAMFRSGGDDFSYENAFVCLPSAARFRPARVTPRPVARGPETALVVGPPGEEIFVDKYGRVKVQFYWDREGQKDASSFAWLRVATPLAGPGWGSYAFPRVGQEVLVAFEDGDPDEPIVVGAVYNAQNMPPYRLPDTKRRTGLKTKTTPQGKLHEFHELFFDDSKGKEQVYFQSQKDFHRLVKNNDKLQVGVRNGDEAIPEGSQEQELHRNRTVNVKLGSDVLGVGIVVKPQAWKDDQPPPTPYLWGQGAPAAQTDAPVRSASDSLPAKGGNQAVYILNDRTVDLKYGNDKLVVGSSAAQRSSPDAMPLQHGNQTVEVANDRTVTLHAGNDKLTIEKGNLDVSLPGAMPGGKVTISAATSIELKVGTSSLKIDQTSVTLSLPTRSVKLDTGGVEIKTTTGSVKVTDSESSVSGITSKLSGIAKAEVSGSAMAELKGAIVTIGGGITKIG